MFPLDTNLKSYLTIKLFCWTKCSSSLKVLFYLVYIFIIQLEVRYTLTCPPPCLAYQLYGHSAYKTKLHQTFTSVTTIKRNHGWCLYRLQDGSVSGWISSRLCILWWPSLLLSSLFMFLEVTFILFIFLYQRLTEWLKHQDKLLCCFCVLWSFFNTFSIRVLWYWPSG